MVVVTKDAADAGSTRWAQGGVAVVVGDVPGDTVAAHAADTLAAGAGLCDEAAAAAILRDGPSAWPGCAPGARSSTTTATGSPAPAKAAHSAFRVMHAGGDATGAEIVRALLRVAAGWPLLAGHVGVDVLRDQGLRRGAGGAGRRGAARGAVRARGAAGHRRLRAALRPTTNPATATGDGMALAMRAGAAAADLEFVQFHPTVLYTGPTTGRRPLVTEAVRGEGAVLLDRAGRRFMTGVHPLADLAPRDVVAAAITAGWPRPPRTASTSTPARSTASPPASRRCTRPAAPRGSTRCASRSR